MLVSGSSIADIQVPTSPKKIKDKRSDECSRTIIINKIISIDSNINSSNTVIVVSLCYYVSYTMKTLWREKTDY